MNPTLLVLNALGYQGGTIHQAAQETGLTTEEILSLPTRENEVKGSLTSDYSSGWCAVRTCNLTFRKEVIYPKYRGNINFWAGVVRGLYLQQKANNTCKM